MNTHQNMFKYYILSLLSTLKNSFIAAASVLTAFVAPIGDVLIFVSLLVIIDFTTGITAAKYRGEIRSSLKMIKSVYKIVFYTISLMVIQFFDDLTRSLFHPHLFQIILGTENAATLAEFKFLAALSFVIIVRELKSIDENWSTIFGWGFINTSTILYDKLILILSLIKSKK